MTARELRYCLDCGVPLGDQTWWYTRNSGLAHGPLCETCLECRERCRLDPAKPSGMTRATFDALIAGLNDYISSLRDDKEHEYADKADTLRNFHVLGPVAGLTPAQYCAVTLVKHVGAIAKQVGSGEWVWAYRLPNGGEGLKQRIADSKNSLDCLFALLDEETRSCTV